MPTLSTNEKYLYSECVGSHTSVDDVTMCIDQSQFLEWPLHKLTYNFFHPDKLTFMTNAKVNILDEDGKKTIDSMNQFRVLFFHHRQSNKTS
jgi:hypothetical protein